jgi:hypothetical protein
VDEDFMSMLYWSKNSDPETYLETHTVGIHGLSCRAIPNTQIAEFRLGSHRCLVTAEQIVTKGAGWANRKLYRFRRYAKRMNRRTI